MNTYRLSITACAFLLVAVCAPFAAAQSTSLDIEAGYQEVDVTGNEDMFRTQINQQDGFVLRNFSINYVDPTGNAGFVDRLRVDASGFGGNPAGRFRLRMGLGDIYRVNLYYQNFATFSALPAYANPLLDDGVYPGQHTWERDRDLLDLQIEILPGRTITPIVGYRWNSYEGPGRTTYSVGNDEFEIDSQLEETEEEFYVGLNFTTKSIQGTFIQGWRSFEGTYIDNLAPGAGAGNNPGTTLGQEVELDAFNRNTTTEADTPVTTFNLTGRVTETSRFFVSYVRADYEGDTTMAEDLSGSLVSFQLSRFFQGLDQSVQSRTENPYWRGEARFEWDISDKVDMRVGYEMRDRQLQGWALISSLYLDTLNFGGFDPQDVATLVDAQTGYEREEGTANIRFDFRNLGAFSFWAEYALTDQDVDLSADVAQIVLPGGQEGEYDRQISSFDLGAMLKVGNFKFLIDAVGQDADEVIVRTDFNDRLRLRGRVDWSINSMFRVLLTAESIDADNDASGIGYQYDTDRYAVDLNFTPTDNFMLRAAWDSYQTDTEMPIRVPQTFLIIPSLYAEEGDLYEGNLRWKIALFTLEAAYSTFENVGSFPFEMERAFARVAVDLSKRISIAGEYENWDYSEDLFPVADYDADRWGFFVRWRR
jgi:hypothetical protein